MKTGSSGCALNYGASAGNGRTGRAIVQAMLRHGQVTTNITVPVSAELLHDVTNYYDTVADGRQLVRDIRTIEAAWETRMSGLRSDAAAHRVMALAIAHPVFNSDFVVRKQG